MGTDCKSALSLGNYTSERSGFGGYDCITTMISANMILFNEVSNRKWFNSSANSVKSGQGANVIKYNDRLVSAGYAKHNPLNDLYKISTNNKKMGDIVTDSDFSMTVSLGDKLTSKTGANEGVYFFNLALGVDFHSMTIVAQTISVPDIDLTTGVQKTDASGNPLSKLDTTFYKADEIGDGWKQIGDKNALDNYLSYWHYLNSTDKDPSTGTRTMSSDPKHRITGNRQHGTFYQLIRK
jgi:hypothetical protein